MRIFARAALSVSALTLSLALAGCVESGRSATAALNTACPWQPDKSITTTARIAYQSIPNADLVVKDRGILEACMPNAKITWSNFAEGADVVQAYGASSIDIGLMGSAPTSIALSEPLDLPVSVVWIHDVIGSAEALVAHDSSVQDVSDLRGGTIAVPFSSTSHYSLLQALRDADLDPQRDVTLINLEPEKMPAAWQAGQIDAAWVWDPALSELTKTGHVVTSSAETAAAGEATYDLGTATDSFIKANPEFMRQWAKAQDYAVNMIEKQPQKASESVAVELGISPAQAADLFGGLEYLRAGQQVGARHLGGRLAEDLLETSRFLASQGDIRAADPASAYADAVDRAPAQEVAR